jgi:pectinacetylesterase
MRVAVAVSLLAAACSHAAPAVDTPTAPAAGPAEPAAPAEATVGDCRSGVVAGAPIEAPADTWTYVPIPEARCRDGSSTGIGVRLHPGATQVAIYFEGGGACFHDASCAVNDVLQSWNDATFNTWVGATGSSGIFDTTRDDNPLRGWNMVYVPYCTGDVHIGANPMGQVDGVTGTQQFVGRTNLQAFLNRLVPTFSKATQVLLTGASAGGFGASANAEFVQWAFGSIPVTMIDDSGPTFSSQYLPTCISMKYRKYWGLDNSILADCGADCPNKDDFSIDYLKHVAKLSGSRMAGLIESSQDGTIRQFYGIATDGGKNDCMGDLILGTPMDASAFTMGLLDFRMTIQSVYPNYGTFFPNSQQHTWISDATFYMETDSSTGTKLVDWFKDILTGTKAAQIGP